MNSAQVVLPPDLASSKGPFLFTGGGTGGHLFPGLAVAEELAERLSQQPLKSPSVPKIIFAGSSRVIEQKILQQTPFAHEQLDFESPRKLLRNPLAFWNNWQTAKQQASLILKKQTPRCVIGLGGYASYPILRQAAKRKIPFVLLEQNAIPGKVTSLFSKQAQAVFTSHEETKQYFSASTNVIFTGNPLRRGVSILRDEIHPRSTPPTLLICGGSQGSQIINQLIDRFLNTKADELKLWKIRHQTGDSKTTNQMQQRYQQQGIEAEVADFFGSPAELYTGVELVLGRAGGTTLAELDWLEIPAILIPISRSVRNHQQLNAEAHLKRNAGQILTEKQIFQDDQAGFKHFENILAAWLKQPLETRPKTSKNQTPRTSACDAVVKKLLEF